MSLSATLPAWKPVLHLVIEIEPVAQPRPRARAIPLKNGKHTAQVYHDKKHPVNAYRLTIADEARKRWQNGIIEGPLRLDIAFIFPRPQRMVWKTKPMPRTRFTSKPDIDNLRKPVMDALTGIMWRDDSQVCDGVSKKFYAAGDESPFVEFKLYQEVNE